MRSAKKPIKIKQLGMLIKYKIFYASNPLILLRTTKFCDHTIPSVNFKVKCIIFLKFSAKTNDRLKNFSYFALKSAAHQLVERL